MDPKHTEESQQLQSNVSTAQQHQTSSSTAQHGEPNDQSPTAVEEPLILPPSELPVRPSKRGGSRAVRAERSLKASLQDSESEDDYDYTCHVAKLPPEALTRVFAFLDPVSLAQASLACRAWAVIGRDDATWRSAYAETTRLDRGTSEGMGLLMRRANSASWKQEYIARADLVRRWKKSRSPAISSDMKVANIHSIALAPAQSFLLSSSVSYGIASRSDPFKGKIARGFIDAAGILNGGGIGNPNAEFSPNVSSLTMSRDATRVAWGFRDGALSLTLFTRQGSNPRGVIRNVRFSPRRAHSGPINAIAFHLNQPGQLKRRNMSSDLADCFVTGGEDGSVRLWSITKPTPLWIGSTVIVKVSSDEGAAPTILAPRAITTVDFDADHGIVCAGTRSGAVFVWTAIDVAGLLHLPISAWDKVSDEVQTPAGAAAQQSLAQMKDRVKRVVIEGVDASPVRQLVLDSRSTRRVGLLVHHEDASAICHHRVNLDSEQPAISTSLFDAGAAITCLRVDITALKDDKSSAIASPPIEATASPLVIGPVQASGRNLSSGKFAERSFIVAGTKGGEVFGWSLDQEHTATPQDPSFRLDVHHAGLTSVDVATHLIVVGTVDGQVKALDSLTGDLLRTFNDRIATKHAARLLIEGGMRQDEAERFTVKQIIVEEESLVAAIGPWLLAWKPETAIASGRRKKNLLNRGAVPGVNGVARRTGGSHLHDESKATQMRNLKTELAESSKMLAAEKEQRQQSYDRLRYARGPAEIGGLSESEALEYALMLSMEETGKVKEEGQQLSQLARIRKEEEELQQALEQIAIAEGDEAEHDMSSAFDPDDGASACSEADDRDQEGDTSYWSTPASPSPYGTPVSSRAWDILNSTTSSSPSASTSRSRWGQHSKVQTVSVPREARMSLSPSMGPSGGPSSSSVSSSTDMASPEHFPSMSRTGSYSASPGVLNTGISDFTLGESRTSGTSPSPWGAKGKEKSRETPSPFRIDGDNATLGPSSPPAFKPVQGAWAKGTLLKRNNDSNIGSAGNASHLRPIPSPTSLGQQGGDEMMDDDLRFAIELSLAEEKSRLEGKK